MKICMRPYNKYNCVLGENFPEFHNILSLSYFTLHYTDAAGDGADGDGDDMHSISDTNVHRSLVNVDNEKLWSVGGFFCRHKKGRAEESGTLWCDITQTLSVLSAENSDNDDEDAMIINQHQREGV